MFVLLDFIWHCINWFLLRFRSFLFFGYFCLHLARCCWISRSVFWGHPLCLLLVLAVLIPKQKLHILKEHWHTTSICLSWHIGMWVFPSCMLVLLRMLNLSWILMLCPCSAVVLFSVVGTPLFRPVPLTLLPYPTAPSPDRTRCLPNFPPL